MFNIGDRRRFLYPNYGNPDGYPDYSAHSTQIVVIVRLLADDEYDSERDEDGVPYDRMYEIRADDGWSGQAWESELHDLEFPFIAGKDQNGNAIRGDC